MKNRHFYEQNEQIIMIIVFFILYFVRNWEKNKRKKESHEMLCLLQCEWKNYVYKYMTYCSCGRKNKLRMKMKKMKDNCIIQEKNHDIRQSGSRCFNTLHNELLFLISMYITLIKKKLSQKNSIRVIIPLKFPILLFKL